MDILKALLAFGLFMGFVTILKYKNYPWPHPLTWIQSHLLSDTFDRKEKFDPFAVLGINPCFNLNSKNNFQVCQKIDSLTVRLINNIDRKKLYGEWFRCLLGAMSQINFNQRFWEGSGGNLRCQDRCKMIPVGGRSTEAEEFSFPLFSRRPEEGLHVQKSDWLK